MKSITLSVQTLIVVSVALLSVGCNDYGQKHVSNGTEIFFDGENVTEANAITLAKALTETGFSDGNVKSVQLTKEEGKWEFRMVSVDNAENDPEIVGYGAIMCLQLSSYFEGEEFEVHLCTETLETKKVLTGLSGKLNLKDEVEVYFDNDVEQSVLHSFQNYLGQAGLAGMQSTWHLGKKGDVLIVRRVARDEVWITDEFDDELKSMAEEISNNVAKGGKVTLHLCNDCLHEKKTFVADSAG